MMPKASYHEAKGARPSVCVCVSTTSSSPKVEIVRAVSSKRRQSLLTVLVYIVASFTWRTAKVGQSSLGQMYQSYASSFYNNYNYYESSASGRSIAIATTNSSNQQSLSYTPSTSTSTSDAAAAAALAADQRTLAFSTSTAGNMNASNPTMFEKSITSPSSTGASPLEESTTLAPTSSSPSATSSSTAFQNDASTVVIPLSLPSVAARTNRDEETHVSFPRWGDPTGIHVSAILAYLDFQDRYPDTAKDLLNPNNFPVPNVFYLFGTTSNYHRNGNHTNTKYTAGVETETNINNNNNNDRTPQVLVSNRRRQTLMPFLIHDRYSVMESLLKDALDYLLLMQSSSSPTKTTTTDTTTTLHNNNFEHLRQIVQSPNTTMGIPLFINLADYRSCSYQNYETLNVPIFTLCAAYHVYNCNYSFPLPSYSLVHLAKKAKHKDWSRVFQEQDDKYPWAEKINKAVWRGTGTGYYPVDKKLLQSRRPAKGENLRLWMVQEANRATTAATTTTTTTSKRRRRRLTTTSNNYTTSTDDLLLDVAFSKGTKVADVRKTPVKDKIPFDDFQKYKAIIDVDGNSWSERFPRLLCMNSVVIKVEPEFVDYFMPDLQPWVHYVPVQMTSKDLANVTRYVMDPQNDHQMKEIVRNARQWCQQSLHYEKLLQFVLGTLDVYVQLLHKSDPHWMKSFERVIQKKPMDELYQFKPIPVK